MAYVSITLEIPERSGSQRFVARDLLEAAVAKWYDMGAVSQSRGAELLGVSRDEFLQVLFRHGVSAIQVDPSEYGQEFGQGE